MSLRTPYRYRDKAPREPKAPKAATAIPAQPGTRYCRWPGRDLLTGAPIEAGADVRAVTDFEWRGAVQRDGQPTAYGVPSLPGISRELHDWPARHAAIADAAAQAAADLAALAQDDESDGDV